MKELPEGWITAPISSLCSLENGRAFKPTEWADKGIPIVRIQNLNNKNAPFNYFDGEYGDRHRLEGGELLFAWSGTPGTSFGAHIWHGERAVLNQHIFRVDFNEATIDKRFFKHAINQKLGELIDIAHGGVGLRHVTKGKFEKTEVLLPPTEEQKRIADKLDSLLARVDASRERLDRVQLILKRFRQSVLAAATSGQLTEDWREENHIRSNNWPTTNLRTVADLRLGKMLDKTKNVGMPTRYIRNINVRWFTFDLSDVALMRATEPDKKELAIKDGDLLVCEGGEPGRCSVWNLGDTDLVFQKAIHRVRCGEDVSAKWVAINLKHDADSGKLDSYFTGTTIKHLTRKALATYEILVPSAGEQQEIIRRVETLFAFADRLEARLEVAQSRVERLTPATLAKAFRGELVPQDPNDEPASELLRRVKLENKKQCRTRFS
ncbi:restriction endonuclease subunit S [Syntrophorhabdus aromaticivorans]|uniref:restriction endonuclease subunit S n=1 Tax=Syntrophorhabdus aromaticivorans TaxID=328301 RepID=UPI0004041896|nr:restriction endonuclease subunit S [Syntrophorhabdus aromaticivorans]